MWTLEDSHGANILTTDICDDREKIIELGKITVDLMNRVPGDLNIDGVEANRD